MTASNPRIKKLTSEKVQQLRDEIIKHDGEEVDLRSRGIESIVSLEGLQTATKLDLSHNKLTKLSQLKSVPRVTMLKLIGNKLTGEGLAEIQHLKKLVILNAAGNLVTRIPFEVLRNVRTLKALVLNNNSISALDWIPKLPNLNSLIVSSNRIAHVPQRVVNGLPSLKKISISHNLLEEIPDLSHLSEITELRLSHNRIKTIPAHLAHLKNLKVLELSQNQIDDWSGLEALSSLKNLRQLNLIGNPICGKKLEAPAKPAKEERENSDIDDSEGISEYSDCDMDDKMKKKSEIKKVGIIEETQELKKARKLDAKHKQYNFKMKRLFPHVVVRDAARVLNKRVHGYVAPPKEDKKSTPSNKEEKEVVTDKRNRDKNYLNFERKASTVTSPQESIKDAEKLSKKKKIQKKHKIENPAADKQTINVVVTSEPEKQNAKYLQKQVETSGLAPVDGNQATLTLKIDAEDKKAVKVKKRKGKKQNQRQPKEIDSGVVAVKQFKKAKRVKNAESKPLDIAQITLTPDVGFGGSSAWD